jgi:hypothetical protein
MCSMLCARVLYTHRPKRMRLMCLLFIPPKVISGQPSIALT